MVAAARWHAATPTPAHPPPVLLLLLGAGWRKGPRLFGPLGLGVLAVLEAGHFELQLLQLLLTLIVANFSLASHVFAGIDIIS